MSTLLTIIQPLLSERLNLSHKKFLIQVIQSILLAWSVNILKLACEIPGNANVWSVIRRLERFLLIKITGFDKLASVILSALKYRGPYVLTMDGTSWRLGKRKYYILAVGICFDGISLPICLRYLPGNTSANFTQEIELMEHVVSVLKIENIKSLVADREFGNTNFIRWLKMMHINFCIRLKGNFYITGPDRKNSRTLNSVFQYLKVGQVAVLRRAYLIRKGVMVRIYCKRVRHPNTEDSLLILASPKGFDCTERLYRLRWSIETAFRGWKTAGFNLEQTHLDGARFENMLALMSIAYAVAFIDGLVKIESIPIPVVKKNGRKRFSILRYGLTDCIHRFWSNVKFTTIESS
ncbi:IS4 family transposase [uncultured Duncaniella sp.]|jgi:hypothetical protein|uniref:IS4 family transposase n=2 Tax=Muribaculaceae TaxID=2005473 RepID=UPI00265B05B1|nr:IS4 family transposase [uncultured Duncaniella sp.]